MMSFEMKMQLNQFVPIRMLVAMSLLTAVAVPCQQTPAQESERHAALAFEQQGRTEEAENAWKAIAARDSKDAEAYAHLGLLEARQEHYQDAIQNYKKALALNPRFPNLRVNLGLSYFKAGELKETIQTYEPMLKEMPVSSPQRARIVALTGLAHYGVGDYGAAAPYLKEAVASDPTNLEFRLMHAHSCLWTKQFECVLDEYKEILTLSPDSAEAHMLAGEAYDGQRFEAKALEEFETAIKKDPSLPNVHFGYGYMEWRLQNFDLAAAQFEAELANNPDHALALTYLGDIRMRQNQPEAAMPLLQHAIKISPSIALSHVDLGTVYQRLNHKEEALKELQTAAVLTPNDQKVHWTLGRFYQSLGRTAEAKVELAKAQSLQKAADESVLDKIRQAKPRTETPIGPDTHQDSGH